MNVRKTGLIVMMLMLLMASMSSALAATASEVKLNPSGSPYMYQKSAGTTNLTAIGTPSNYLIQGSNPTATSRVVKCELFVSNKNAGYSTLTTQVASVKQAAICSASVSRPVTVGDAATYVVSKYTSNNIQSYESSSMLDEVTMHVFNFIP